MTPSHKSTIDSIWYRAGKERFSGTPSQWVEANIRFNEPGRVGQFSFRGRRYLEEPLNCYGDDGITDMVLTFGTRTGKTTVLFAGTGYRVHEKMRRILFVKPGAKGTAGAENDAKTRFIPMCKASDVLAELIPTGAARHSFKTAQQIFRNGSIVDWTGSNSVANLASNSMQDINQDEVDKFNATRRRDENGDIVEADAVDLADERAGEYRNPKRVKASTPTLETGRIWTELLKTDLRRRFVPCPLCGKNHPKSRLVVLAWSKEFTVLPTKFSDGSPLPMAYVQWDNEAKRADGSWDLDRVERSAGYVCPHCNGRFNDDEQIWMDENGIWKPTQTGAPRTAGFHLPSMYSSHEQTSAGKLALDFLEGLKSLEGPRNVINSKFAEPYSNTGGKIERVEIVSPDDNRTDGSVIMSAHDLQLTGKRFWQVIAEFKPAENLFRILSYANLEHESEVIERQKEFGISDHHMGFDSGKFATDCYDLCLKHCKRVMRGGGLPPLAVGWTPIKGFKHTQFWRDKKTGMSLPFTMSSAPLPHRRFQLPLLEFNAHELKDMMWRIRRNKTHVKFEVAPSAATDEFWKHLDGEVRKQVIEDGRLVYRWRPRAKTWPNHMGDCVNMLLAMALFHKQLLWVPAEKKDTEEITVTE